jgi:hypothetical protein
MNRTRLGVARSSVALAVVLVVLLSPLAPAFAQAVDDRVVLVQRALGIPGILARE